MEKRWSNSRSIKWDESQILGRGCEGTVVFSGHFNGKPVAVKRILLTNTQQVERELEALLLCSHPRILQLFHVEKEDPFLRLALELCVGTLDDYCKGKYTGVMPEETEALKQMLEGINFIHLQKFVHRDVKPNNILISQSGGLKIADFGFCKPVKGIDQFSMSAAGVGTGGWMAPEVLQSITDFESGRKAAAHATTAIDVFPLGCVFYYFVTKGLHPFGNAPVRNSNILIAKYDLSKLGKKNILRGLIKEMISAHPNERPKLDEVLTRPIFNANVTSSEELLKDDTKFAVWLKNLKKQFASNKKKAYRQMNTQTDECDSPGLLVPGPLPRLPPKYNGTLSAANARMIPLGQTSLQVVDEELNIAATDGFKMPTTRPKADSESRVPRLQVSSGPPSWQRTVPRSRPNRMLFMSEYYADGEEDSDSMDSPRLRGLRNVASMTNLEHGSTDDMRFSNHSLASSTPTKSGSLLSLGRSFIGDLFNKSV